LASIGTKVDISQFPPPDSLTDPELAGPVQLLRSATFDIPIESLTHVDVPSGSPRGTITLPLFKGAVKTPSGLKPAWYIILDAGDQAEADRLGVNFSKKLPNAGDAARPATLRADGTFLFESGIVDFSPNRLVVPGREDRPFPPSIFQPGSVGDANYSPLVNVDGIVYDAPVIAAALEDSAINFPIGNPNYSLVHDQVIALCGMHRSLPSRRPDRRPSRRPAQPPIGPRTRFRARLSVGACVPPSCAVCFRLFDGVRDGVLVEPDRIPPGPQSQHGRRGAVRGQEDRDA